MESKRGDDREGGGELPCWWVSCVWVPHLAGSVCVGNVDDYAPLRYVTLRYVTDTLRRPAKNYPPKSVTHAKIMGAPVAHNWAKR